MIARFLGLLVLRGGSAGPAFAATAITAASRRTVLGCWRSLRPFFGRALALLARLTVPLTAIAVFVVVLAVGVIGAFRGGALISFLAICAGFSRSIVLLVR